LCAPRKLRAAALFVDFDQIAVRLKNIDYES